MRRKRVAAGVWIAAALLIGAVLEAPASANEIEDTLILDNETVEVVPLTFPPGSISEQHANPEPELGIILEGELTLITPSGREVLKPGGVKWLAPLTPHEARNEGTAPVKMWALTLKKCR
jgi:quercetin dioxygenase-like cupin family protein